MRETISIAAVLSHSSAGDPTRAAVVTAPARVERALSRVPLAGGADLAEGTKVFTTFALKTGDMVFLSEDNPADTNTGRIVMDVQRLVAFDGTVTQYVASL